MNNSNEKFKIFLYIFLANQTHIIHFKPLGGGGGGGGGGVKSLTLQCLPTAALEN
jgi:hypothetical protein